MPRVQLRHAGVPCNPRHLAEGRSAAKAGPPSMQAPRPASWRSAVIP